MSDPVYLIPDTNALLHWPQPDQVDWIRLSEAGSSNILLITFAVIHELDDKKTHAQLGKRAQQIIRFVEKRRSTAIRPGVRLEIDHHECQREEFEAGTTLSFDRPDDHVILRALDHKKRGKPIVVVTDDLGMRLKCEPLGLAVARPPSERLPDSVSRDLKRLRSAEAELAALKSRRAQLNVRATLDPDGSEPRGRVSVDLTGPEPIDKEAELRRLREKFRPLVVPARSPFDAINAMSLRPGLSGYQVKSYNTELEEFFENCERYFEALEQDHNLFALRRLGVTFWLVNSGSLRAEEIDVDLAVQRPPVSAVCEADIDFYAREGWEPLSERPKPPKIPKPMHPLDLLPLPRMMDLTLPVAPLVTFEAPQTQENGIDWSASVRQLRHNDQIKLGCYVFLLDSNDWSGFSVDYQVRDTTNPKPQTGSVVFHRRGAE